MSIKDRFLKALGIAPKLLKPIVKDEATTDPGDRVEIAARTREVLYKPAETAPPGRPFVGITTDDIDPRTGRLYPDYMERRAEREAKRQPQPAELCTIDWDISPK
jgi:hypothetical protein